MRIHAWLERGSPPRQLNPIFGEAFELLTARGHTVVLEYPEQQLVRLDDLRVEADLYLLKSDTEPALSLAMALEHMGGAVLNSASASALVKDKLQTALLLAQAGIPAPRSLAAGAPAQLQPALASGALILKPHRGYHGVGISVAETVADLRSAHPGDDVVFAQTFISEGRRDLKIYGIGEDVFGVRKPFAADSYRRGGQPTQLPRETPAIARKCADVCGLRLFGLDIAETPDGPLVIDVNYFPGYRGVPDAARRLADYIDRAVRHAA